MVPMQARMTKWVEALQAQNFSIVISELREYLEGPVDEQTNKLFFKLLLYLSHAAHACKRTDFESARKIYALSSDICSKMTNASDAKRFLQSIMHITKYLLEMQQFDKAMRTFDWAIDSNLINEDAASGHKDIYRQSSGLWKAAICNSYLKQPTSSNPRTSSLIELIRYELDTTKISSCDHTQSIINKMIYYFKQLRGLARRSGTWTLLQKFESFAMEYLHVSKMKTRRYENPTETFKSICSLIGEMITSYSSSTKSYTIGDKAKAYFDVLRPHLPSHERCLKVFDLYERICEIFLDPLEKTTVGKIDLCTVDLQQMDKEKATDEIVESVLYSTTLWLGPVLAQWEEAIKSKTASFPDDVFVASMTLIEVCSAIFCSCKPSICGCDLTKCRSISDIYSGVALRVKAGGVVSRLMMQKSTRELIDIAYGFAYSSAQDILIMSANGCARWSGLWTTCSAHIYNIGINCEPNDYEDSVKFHSLLCKYITDLEGPEPKKPFINLADPMSDVLHRLTSVHYRHGFYDEAAIVCSLNGSLSYEKSEDRAFRYWAKIKTAHPARRDQTMLSTLKTEGHPFAKKLGISPAPYDVGKLILRELKALQGCRGDMSIPIMKALDELETHEADRQIYARGVHSLGYHVLNFGPKEHVQKYLQTAMWDYEKVNSPSATFRWYYANLQFYKFVDKLEALSATARAEVTAVKNSLPTSPPEAEPEPTTSIFPTRSINLAAMIDLQHQLELALQRWEEAFEYGCKHTLPAEESAQTLHVVTIAAEYARLYHLETLEPRAWKLVYELAVELNDDASIVYATSRGLTGLRFDRRWIETADRSANAISDTVDPSVKETLAGYRLSLAQFYFITNEHDEAKKSFRLVADHLGANFLVDIPNYNIRNDIIMNYLWSEYSTSNPQLEYHGLIVEILYGVLTLDTPETVVPYGKKEKQLYYHDALLEYTCNFAARINSLLSYQEIMAHLLRRLDITQNLGAILRVAECLKIMSYLDLSRAAHDECEAKLQSLEQILEIGSSDRGTSPIPPISSLTTSNDVNQKDTAPTLRKKSFSVPRFFHHGETCRCFKCTNVRYQYLTFAATHIRAQLYSLQRNSDEAAQYFDGAFDLWKNIAKKSSKGRSKSAVEKITSLPRQQTLLEYAMLHLDYCRFLKEYKRSDGKHEKFALKTKKLCETHLLKNHPIYMSIVEFIIECRFEERFTSALYADFAVANYDEMNASVYYDAESEPSVLCVTPVREAVAKEPKPVRRKKMPIDLNKAIEGDITESAITISPVVSAPKRVRRRFNEKNDPAMPSTSSEEDSPVEKVNIKMPKGKSTSKSQKLPSVVISLISDDEDESPGSVNQLADRIKDLNVAPDKYSSTNTRIRKKSREETATSSASSDIEVAGKPSETSKVLAGYSYKMKDSNVASDEYSSTNTRIRKKSREETAASSASSDIEVAAKPSETSNVLAECFDKMKITKSQKPTSASQSRPSKPRKPAKKSSSSSLPPPPPPPSSALKNTEPVLLPSASESDSGTEGKRTSARLRKKKEDLDLNKRIV